MLKMLVHVLCMQMRDKEGLRVPLNLSSLRDAPIKVSHTLISVLHTKFTRAELEKNRYQAKHSLGAVRGINVQQLLQNVLKTVFIASVFRWFLIKKYQRDNFAIEIAKEITLL